MLRNYFADLELDTRASLDEVKRAYRRLARRFHPDLNPGDLYAEHSFKRITEAYDQLSETESLEKWRSLISPVNTETPKRWDVHALIPKAQIGLIVEDPRKRGEDLDIHLLVELPKDELIAAGHRAIEISVDEGCSNCRGSGGSSRSVQSTCKTCAGLGYRMIRRGAFRWKKTCDECIGKGYQVAEACASCQGYGKIQVQRKLELAVPQRLRDVEIQYPGLGHMSFDGKKRGDLWVNWKIKK